MAEHVTKEKRRSFRVIPYTKVVKYPLTPNCEVLDISCHGALLEISLSDIKIGNILNLKFALYDIPIRGRVVRAQWATKPTRVAVEFDERSRLMVEPLVNFAREHAIKYVTSRIIRSSLVPRLPG